MPIPLPAASNQTELLPKARAVLTLCEVGERVGRRGSEREEKAERGDREVMQWGEEGEDGD